MIEEIVLIKWEDSRVPRNNWEWITEELTPKCTSCMSVGFIVAESDNAILLSPTIGHEEDGDRQMIGAITIAKRQILKTICLSSLVCLEPVLNQSQQHFFDLSSISGRAILWMLLKRLRDLFFRFLPLEKPMNIEKKTPNARVDRPAPEEPGP